MNSCPSSILIALGAICGAILSALVAFLSLVISKEQKVSEFRQNWIDALREDLADFLGLANGIRLEVFALDGKAEQQDISALDIKDFLSKHVGDIYAKYHRIVLRLNPKEHKALLSLLERLEKSLSNPEILLDHGKFDGMCVDITSEAQWVLKQAWNRVKQGEPVYQVAKILSTAVAGFLLIFIGYAVYVQPIDLGPVLCPSSIESHVLAHPPVSSRSSPDKRAGALLFLS
jgi:hypothetical protein